MKIVLKKSLILILVVFLLMGILQTISNAEGGHSEQIMTFIKEEHNDSTGTAEKVSGMSSTIITIIRIAAVCVAIVMLLVLAMKYMIAAPGEKADIKKSAIPYTIGAIVLFGAVGILGIIEKFSATLKVE